MTDTKLIPDLMEYIRKTGRLKKALEQTAIITQGEEGVLTDNEDNDRWHNREGDRRVDRSNR
jgi:hypothetical protein